MTYDLAKQLLEAGFPKMQGYRGGLNSDHWNNDLQAYIPTLSELIEACGGSCKALVQLENGAWEAGTGICWYGGAVLHHQSGATPDEAVANLWLVLNKK